jgi:hypothetical protein
MSPVFFNTASKPFKACLVTVTRRLGPFFTLKGFVWKPIVSARGHLKEVQWRPRRPAIAVVDIPYSYQAISLTISAFESFIQCLVVFLLPSRKKI